LANPSARCSSAAWIATYCRLPFYISYGVGYRVGLLQGKGQEQAYSDIYWEQRAHHAGDNNYNQGVRPRARSW
jgi:hypothetical protein